MRRIASRDAAPECAPSKKTTLRRIGCALAVAATFVLVPATQAYAADANVTVVHGIGPAPMAIDVYLDDNLIADDFQYSDQFGLNIAEGAHNVKFCNHNAAPPDPLVGACPSGALNQNPGDPISLVGNQSYTLVAAYSPDTPAEGRPEALLFADDLLCTSGTSARMDIYHAAAFAGAIDLLYEAQVIADAVAPAGTGHASGPPKTAEVQVLRDSDASVLVTQANVTTTAQSLTIKILVGNPQQNAPYALLTRQVTLTGCPTTTTSSTSTTSTTTTTVRAVTVTPRFTG